jgi:GH43 family beta-xylosidase
MKVSRFYLLAAAVLVSAGFLIVSCAGSPDAAVASDGPFNEEFYNPVTGLADPSLVYHNGYYYMPVLQGNGIGLIESKTLSGLLVNAAMPVNVWSNPLPSPNEFWAPSLFFFDGFWYIYFPAIDSTLTNNINWGDDRRRMYVLKSQTEDPLDEWDFLGKLDLPDSSFAKDGILFQNDDGKLYYIWSGWEKNIRDFSEQIYICEMDSPSLVKEGSKRVMIAKPELNWEKAHGPNLDSPFILKQPNGTIKCLYAGDMTLDDSVCIGELTLQGDPMDPKSWKKRVSPVLQGDPLKGVYSPGHPSITTSPDGSEIWMIYHISQEKGSGLARQMVIQKLNFDSNGNLAIKGPTGGNEAYKLPSGEQADRYIFDIEKGKYERVRKVSLKGAHGGGAARFLSDDGVITLEVEVPEGDYNLYLRHSHPAGEERSAILEIQDEGSFMFKLIRSGGAFSMSVGGQTYFGEGKHTLIFRGSKDVALDAVILEKL